MSTPFKQVDFYNVLGLPRSASPSAVRRAYRQRALTTHPDKGGSAEQFRLVVRAFETLGSLFERSKYDGRTELQESKPRGRHSFPGTSSPGSCGNRLASAKHTPHSDPCLPNSCGNRPTSAKQTPHTDPYSPSGWGNRPASAKRSSHNRPGPPLSTAGASGVARVAAAAPAQAKLAAQTGSATPATPIHGQQGATSEGQPPLKRRHVGERLAGVLESLRSFLSKADREIRAELLGSLCHHVRQSLLEHMQKSGSNAPSSQIVVDGRASSRVVESSCTSSESSGESLGGAEDPIMGGAIQNTDKLQDASRHSLKSLTWHESSSEDLLTLEDASTADHDPAARCTGDSASHASHRGGRGSRTGICGIATWTETRGNRHQVYRAKISCSGLIVKSRTHNQLENAISDHMSLVQLRDLIRDTLDRHRVTFGDAPSHVLDEILAIDRKAHLDNSHDEYMFTYCASVSAYSLLGCQLFTPHTRSLSTCLKHMKMLIDGKRKGWEELRSVWCDISKHVEPRISGARGNSVRTPAQMCDFIDSAYERHAHVRARKDARKERFLRCLQERAEERQTREAMKLRRRFARAAFLAERLLGAQLTSQQKETVALRKQQLNQAQQELRMRQVERERRWQWHHRKDLTMEEILHGPPEPS